MRDEHLSPRRARRLTCASIALLGMTWAGPDATCDPTLRCSSGGAAPAPDAAVPEPWCTSESCGALAVSAGAHHTCAMVGDLEPGDGDSVTSPEARVVCWGRNDEGQSDPARLGADVVTPTRVITPPLGAARRGEPRIATGTVHSCAAARASAGPDAITCWGSNVRGLLGGTDADGRMASTLGTVSLFGNGDDAEVHAGATHTCATWDAELDLALCVGDNSAGQIEADASSDFTPPAFCVGPIGCPHDIVARELALGARATCGVERTVERGPEGEEVTTAVRCTGDPSFHGLDALVGDAGAAVAVAVEHACAIGVSTGEGSDRRVMCWGRSPRGAVGHEGLGGAPLPPVSIELEGPVIDVAVGGALDVHVAGPLGLELRDPVGGGHTCALLATGAVFCWGANDRGQLGDGTTEDRARPVRVVDLPPAVGLEAGGEHTCALTEDAAIHCWGDNRRAQLARSPSELELSPRPLRIELR